MKYMLMFASETDDPNRFENLNQDGQAAVYARVGEWFQKYGSKTTTGERLQAPAAATTVRFTSGQKPLVTDGPFIEGKEIVGYCIVDAASIDEALTMAREWPAQSMVEVRPVQEMAH
jgi:hypothetical protein